LVLDLAVLLEIDLSFVDVDLASEIDRHLAREPFFPGSQGLRVSVVIRAPRPSLKPGLRRRRVRKNDRPRGKGLNLPPRLLGSMYMAFRLRPPGRQALRARQGFRARLQVGVAPGSPVTGLEHPLAAAPLQGAVMVIFPWTTR